MSADALASLAGRHLRVVAIGASAGAVDALGLLLPQLPKALPVPFVIVVHVPPDRASLLPAHFASISSLPVLEAEDKTPLMAGHIYLGPPDYHLLVERDGTTSLSTDAPVHHSRPSIDVLFESVADACGAHALGIVLSGANADGAAGLAQMRARGAVTWVQSPETATSPSMPEAALALADHLSLPPAAMGQVLSEWGRADG